jgi:hypothetical protein
VSELHIDIVSSSSKAQQEMTNFVNAVSAGVDKLNQKLETTLNKPAKKTVEMDFKGVERVNKDMKAVDASVVKLKKTIKEANQEFGRTPNEVKKSLQALISLRNNTQKFQSGTRALTPAWQAVTAKIQRASAEAKKLGVNVRGAKDATNQLGGGGGFASVFTKFVGVQTAANLATAAIMKVGDSIVNLVQTGMEMEVLSLQLEGFLGDAEAAAEAFETFADIAANTPFNLQQVAQAGKIMLAFGMEADQAMEATERLSIVAAATGGDIQLLGRNMGQIVAQGQAYTRDLTQFAIQGIPIWAELSTVTGESVTALKQMAREGKIGASEVMAAMRNLTSETSRYREIAERMQETFTGRLAKIEASFQKLALAAIQNINNLDAALGGVVSGGMSLLADSLNWVADNFSTVMGVIAGVGAALAALALATVAANWAAVSSAIGLAIGKFTSLKVVMWAVVAVKKVLLLLSGPGGWAILATAGAIGLAAGIAIKSGMDQAKEGLDSARLAAYETKNAVGELTDEEERLAQAVDKGVSEEYKKRKEAANEAKEAVDAQVAQLERLKESINSRYDEEIDKIKATKEEASYIVAVQQDEYDTLKGKIKDAYEPAIDSLDRLLDKTREKNSLELEGLQARTPAEQRLLDFEKESIKNKLAKGGLDKEERLRLEARLSRMEQQEKIDEARKRHKAEEEQIEKRKTALVDKQAEAEKQLEQNQGKRLEESKQRVKDLNLLEQKLNLERAKALKPILDAIKSTKAYEVQIDDSTRAVNEQVKELYTLQGEWEVAKGKVIDYASEVRSAIVLAKELEAANAAAKAAGGDNTNSGTQSRNSRRGVGFNFAGGPMSGGELSHVNEFGQEAFLTKGGHLSLINAKPWDIWRAPNAGTVIPAHLTKQLDIPSGGVNVNKAAAAQTSRAAAGGANLAGAVRSLKGTMGNGDRITNNVTIQAANTTQAASDMMVQLNKIRRRRMG